MSFKLPAEHSLEFLSLKGSCTGSSESTIVKNATLLEITCHGSYCVYLIKITAVRKTIFIRTMCNNAVNMKGIKLKIFSISFVYNKIKHDTE